MKKWVYICAVFIYTVIAVGLFIYKGKSPEVIVPGQVVGSKWTQHHGKTPDTYSAIISFELNGHTHQFTRKPSSWFKPKMGRVYEVAVDPEHPTHARTLMPFVLEKLLPHAIKQHPDILYPWLVGYICFVLWFLLGFCTQPSSEKNVPAQEGSLWIGIFIIAGLLGLLFWGLSLID